MAATVSSKIFKERFQENLRNRGQIDTSRVKFASYSTTDVTVGGSDTLELKIAELPQYAVLKSITVTPNVLNGAALTCTITDGTNLLHATTYNLNTGADLGQYKAAATAYITDAAARDIYIVFPNSAACKAILDIEVTLEFFFSSVKKDQAGLTA